jgi:hypothetical protein
LELATAWPWVLEVETLAWVEEEPELLEEEGFEVGTAVEIVEADEAADGSGVTGGIRSIKL